MDCLEIKSNARNWKIIITFYFGFKAVLIYLRMEIFMGVLDRLLEDVNITKGIVTDIVDKY